MQKVVIDTNILVSALWNPHGTPAKLLALMANNRLIPCYDAAIMLEYRVVLNRPKLNFSGHKVNEVLNEFVKRGLSVVVEQSNIPMVDESDRKFYDVFKACKAVLITGNMKHFPKESFILTAAEFLDAVEQEKSK